MTNTLSTVIALPYEVARLPLTVADKALSGRLSETSAPRVILDRTIGSADKLAGSLLGNAGLAQRGVDRVERTEKLVTAARLEKEAEARRQEAAHETDAAREEAASKRRAAKDRAGSGLVEADAAEARGKQEAKERAARVAAEKKTEADRRAANRTATVEARKERVQSAAEAERKRAAAEAEAELEDARESQQAAAEARSDAERLDDLTEVKKRERKQD